MFSPRGCPEPKEHQRQSADILCDDAAPATNWRRKFQCEISRTASEVDNYVAGPKIQRLDNVRRPLPLVTISLHFIQARDCLERGIASIEDKKDSKRTEE